MVKLYDKDIREPLFDFLEEAYGKVRILEEKTMGKSRADVVMVTPNALFGIEIKSDADTYARLGRQVKDYNQYYDYNYVVAGTSHALHVEEHIPEWWGVITAELVEDTVVAGKILERIPEETLQAQLCEELFERDYNGIAEAIRSYRKANQ